MGTRLDHDPTHAPYRGRLAPTPSGHLHVGHAHTFWIAQQRARQHGGTLVLRNEDLDPDRSRPEFAQAMLDDLRWFGFRWQEGPDVGGPHGPYVQSQRTAFYHETFTRLAAEGVIYPSPHSRKDIAGALVAPHDEPQRGDATSEASEPLFPVALRPARSSLTGVVEPQDMARMNWRFWVPDGAKITFEDGRHGPVERVAGVDFGDFLVWRKDGLPAYELAVTHDDHAMRISEVVRGEDLLTSTARQLLLYQALGWTPPRFYHGPLLRDPAGRRLAKRSQAVSLRSLRAAGQTPAEIRANW